MTTDVNYKRAGKIGASLAKTFKSRSSVISVLLIAVLVALSLGLSSIGLISAQAPPVTELKPQQFNLDTAYAYVGQGFQNDTFTDSRGNLLSPVSEYPSAVYFNLTRPNVENVVCDGILEVYHVTISSDKGPTEKFVYFAGTNYNPSFSKEEYNTLTEGIYNLFNLNAVDGITGNFRFNWTNDESILSVKVGSFGIYTNYANGPGLWSEGKPDVISVNIHRIGYVTMTNGVVSVQPDTQSVTNKTQVQLQEHNDGFLKNEIVPMNQISQNNRFTPLN